MLFFLVKISNILFFNTLVMGTLISISSFSWFSMWIGLEINMLSFIPLMNESKTSISSEASLKYFIVQAISSMIVLFTFLVNLIFNEQLSELSSPLEIIFSSALLTKMGAAPFHFWFPEIIEGISWMTALILLTWQKVAPMILIMYNFYSKTFFSFIIMISMIVSGLNSWNQTSMKKILAFSSINHIGWMLSILMFNQSLWMFYFSIYSFITVSMISILSKFSINSIQNLFSTMNSDKPTKLFFFMNFFSLGGLPPFLGFFPKWVILKVMWKNEFFILAFSMIFLTLVVLFVYLRLMFQALTFKNSESKLNIQNKNFFLNILSFLNLTGLIFCSLTLNL